MRTQWSIFLVGAGNFGGKRNTDKGAKVLPPPKRKPDAVIEEKTSIDQVCFIQKLFISTHSVFGGCYVLCKNFIIPQKVSLRTNSLLNKEKKESDKVFLQWNCIIIHLGKSPKTKFQMKEFIFHGENRNTFFIEYN